MSLDEELRARRKEHRARNSPHGRSRDDDGHEEGSHAENHEGPRIMRGNSDTDDSYDSNDPDADQNDGITTWRREESGSMMDVPSAAESYWPNRDYETDHATIAKPPSRGWSPAFTDFVNREHKVIRFNVGGKTFAT